MNRSELKRKLTELQDQFEQRVVDQLQLILQAQRVAPNACFHAGESAESIRRKAVGTALGDAAIAGKPEVYIEARFDHLAEQKPLDPVAKALAYRMSARQH